MKRSFLSACGFALAMAVAAPASASTVELELVGIPNSSLVQAYLDGDAVEDSGPFQAGAFEMEDTSTFERFMAWCLEVTQVLNPAPTTYNTHVTLLSPEKETLVSKLFTGFLNLTDSDLGAAAFQLALWEIVEETGPTLDIGSGFFTATADIGVLSVANLFLSNLGDYDANYRITYFQNGNSQDIITAAPVPLPASVLLLGAGIGGMAFVSRRRKAKAENA